jgi:tetratricopeptide (TPR) repeat protein
VQLLRVSDGVQLWGADYEREDQSPFGVPNEIALAIASDLRIPPEVTEWSDGTKDNQAHEDYLKGVFFWNKRLKEDVLIAIDYFSRAISRDPNYARPYAGLADSYIVLAGHHLPANAAYAKAREYAEKAVLLDENLAEAHASLAYVMYGENWDWTGAEREYRRATALDPEYAVAHHWYFMYLTAMRRFPEAIAEAKTALALDPLSQSINNNAGVTYFMAHEYDRAIRQLQKGIELDPNNPVAHGYLGEVYVQQGKYTLAIREFQRARALEPERNSYDFALAGADAASGRIIEANRLGQKLTNYSKTHYTDPMWFVAMYSGFKDRDKTLLWVGAAVRAHSCTALDMNADPRVDFVRSDPRFEHTIAAMHLPQ